MTESPHALRQRTLSDYLAILRRRKWVVIESVVLVALVTGALSLQQAKVYRATAAMLVNRQDLGAAVTGLSTDNAGRDPARSVQTQAALARVPDVVQRTIKKAGVSGISPGQLLLSSTVTGSADSDFLTFVVENGDADAARALATAYANSYAEYQLQLDTSTLKRARTELDARAKALAATGDRSSALYRDVVQKAQQLRTLELLQQRNEVVKPAARGLQIAPTPKRNALLGALVGLILGLGIAAVWEALDKKIRTEEEIEDYLDLPVLAKLPAPPEAFRSSDSLVMLDDPGSIHAEAVRRLRTNVEFAILDADTHVMMITSAVGREGKSTTIANLAVALARTGRKVALADLDLRQPTIDRYFGLRSSPGVTDVALGRSSLSDALVQISIPHRGPVTNIGSGSGLPAAPGMLSVLPAGALPASPGEFVGTEALGRLLTELKTGFDLVLIDAPPMCVVGDAMTLSARVDALIVVARVGTIERRTLEELDREVAASPARALGVVITGIDANEAYGYGGYDTREPSSEDSRSTRRQRSRESVSSSQS